VTGVFQPSRIRPKFLEQLRVSGIMLPSSMFEQVQEVN
jgi:pilus assembly protein CpaF